MFKIFKYHTETIQNSKASEHAKICVSLDGYLYTDVAVIVINFTEYVVAI